MHAAATSKRFKSCLPFLLGLSESVVHDFDSGISLFCADAIVASISKVCQNSPMKRAFVILFWLVILALAALASGRISFPATKAKVDPAYGPRGTRALAIAKYDVELQQRVDAVLKRIEKAAVEIFPQKIVHGPKALSDVEVARLESDFSFAVPGELRAFLKSEPVARIPWPKIWSQWQLYGPDDISQWSIGEYLSWCNPIYKQPSAENCEWGPGVMIFMADSYEFFAIDIETGEIYIIDPESGFEYQAGSLLAWLEKTASRLEEKSYVNNEYEFFLTKNDGTQAASPGGPDE